MLLVIFLRLQLNRNSECLFLPLKTEVLKFHTVLFSVYFVSELIAFDHVYRLVLVFYTLEFQPFVTVFNRFMVDYCQIPAVTSNSNKY